MPTRHKHTCGQTSKKKDHRQDPSSKQMKRVTNEYQYTLKECKYCHKRGIHNKDMAAHHLKSCFIKGNRYKFIKSLSRTLQGHIILAIDTTHNTRVVIKSAYRSLVQNGISWKNHKIMENFLKERAILHNLSQQVDFPRKGIAQCLDSWDDSKCHYYTMKLYNMSLFDYIASHFRGKYGINKRCSSSKWIKRVQIIFRRLCHIIQWLHSKGYCHLDLSIENCMVDPSTLEVTVIDFGTVKESKDGCFQFQGMVGKLEIMSPEVYSNVMEYDGRLSDVYSLGSVLYTLLFGLRPYGQDDSNAFPIKPPTTKNVKGFRLLLDEHRNEMMDEVGLKALNLLKCMFRFESTRPSLEGVLCHPFVLYTKHGKERVIAEWMYADILERVMSNNCVDIVGIWREDIGRSQQVLFLDFVAECVEKESLNVVEPHRLLHLYTMIDTLYVNYIISLDEIGLYFKHLLYTKYWMNAIDNGRIKYQYSALRCLSDYGKECDEKSKLFRSILWNTCRAVYYHDKRYRKIIENMGDLVAANLISWKVVFDGFIHGLLTKSPSESMDIAAGFELLQMVSLQSNNYNNHRKEINNLINTISRNQHGKSLVLLIKMKKHYQNAIYSARLPPPGFTQKVCIRTNNS